MVKTYKRLFYVLSCILIFAACTPQKNLMYFQPNNQKDTANYYKYTYQQGQENYSPNYSLKTGDILYIQIKSAVDAESNKVFGDNNNYYTTTSESGIYLSSYVIDNNGEVNLPIVGKVKVSGMTIEQARQTIEGKVGEWLVKPVVVCKMVSFNVSVLGDVNRPGTYTFYKDNVSIFDIVAAAGDLTYYGNRAEVKIVRKTAGEDIVIKVDLRKVDILKDKQYYLQPGDIVYVRSNKVTKSLSYFSQPLSTITASMSLIATIVTLVIALKK